MTEASPTGWADRSSETRRLPDIGQYTSPDPEHLRGAKNFYGPQAYSYASGRPFVNIDPDGRVIPAPPPPGPVPDDDGQCMDGPVTCELVLEDTGPPPKKCGYKCSDDTNCIYTTSLNQCPSVIFKSECD